MVYYFAYGSNMNNERMIKRGVIYSERVGGKLNRYKLVFNKIADENRGTGYANIIPDDHSAVEGVVYKTDEKSISKLDSYEGVTTMHYYKTEMPINTTKGTLECVVYIAHQPKKKTGLKPTKDYLQHLLKGKEYLSEKYYEWLSKIETVD